MEQSEHTGYETQPSYWPSVFLAAIVFAFILAAGQLIGGYMSINTGQQVGWVNFAICIIAAFSGMVAVWHYANEYDVAMTLGKGALMGFWAGFLAQLIAYGLLEVWYLLSPGYEQALKEVQIAAIEANDQFSDEMKEASIDFINNPGTMWTVIVYVGGTIIAGILSLLTGMLGVKLFARKETL